MNTITYVYILKDTLEKKTEILKKIIMLLSSQQNYLSTMEISVDVLDSIFEEKKVLLKKLNELDVGFEHIYDRVREEVLANRLQFKDDIIIIQERIRVITSLSIEIQKREKELQKELTEFFTTKKKEVKQFKKSNQMVNSYYKNMSNAHQGQSLFLDKKN